MEPLLSIYPVAIEGKFARLREFGPNDAEDLVACSQDQAVARFMRWAPQTLDEARTLVERSSTDARKVPRSRYHLAGVDLESGDVFAIIRLSVTSRENGRVRISMAVRPDLRGQGRAPAIWGDVLAFVFEELRAHRLYALIHEENRRSRRFAEKMDLILEGKQREYFFEDSAWKDVLLYSTLRSEWEAMRAKRLLNVGERT